MKIHFDDTNLLARMVGADNGVSPGEIEDAAPAALAALDAFERSCREGRYGFPDLPSQDQTLNEILSYAGEVRGSFDTVCLAGIGGSALGAWAIDCAIRGPHPVQPPFSSRNPRLVVLDNVDPSLIGAAVESINPKKTLLVVVAKSGATAETVAAFMILYDWLRTAAGRKTASRIAVVTSKGRGDLEQLALREGFRIFHLPDNVGGRFSVLSAVGLLPAALTGVDVRKLVRGAAAATGMSWQRDLGRNIALRSALMHYLVLTQRHKSVQVAFPYSNRLWGAAFWFRQLWAESLGKARNRKGALIHAGQTPVAALGTTDQHSQVQLYMEGPNDKVHTFWAVERQPDVGRIPKTRYNLEGFDYLAGQSLARLLDAERRSTAAALTANGRPNCTFTLGRVDEEHLGAFFQILEFQTAYAGELLDINAFDQEGVELGKKFTFGLMGRKGFQDFKRRFADYEKQRGETFGV